MGPGVNRATPLFTCLYSPSPMGHLLDDKRATLTAWPGGRLGTVAVTERYKCSADIAFRHTPGLEQLLAVFRDECFLREAIEGQEKARELVGMDNLVIDR